MAWHAHVHHRLPVAAHAARSSNAMLQYQCPAARARRKFLKPAAQGRRGLSPLPDRSSQFEFKWPPQPRFEPRAQAPSRLPLLRPMRLLPATAQNAIHAAGAGPAAAGGGGGRRRRTSWGLSAFGLLLVAHELGGLGGHLDERGVSRALYRESADSAIRGLLF